MDQFMHLQIASISKGFTTEDAKIWFLPVMNQFMVHHVAQNVAFPNMGLCVSCGFAVNIFGKEKDQAKHNGEYGRGLRMEATMKALLPGTQNN